MKSLPKFSAMEVMLGLSVAGMAVLAVFLAAQRLQPPPMTFESLEVVNSPVSKSELLYVVAETRRRDLDDCTNGVQVDVRDLDGSVTRLPVPAREITDAVSKYSIVLPETTNIGAYGLRIRETWYCGDRPHTVETPWLPIEVLQ